MSVNEIKVSGEHAATQHFPARNSDYVLQHDDDVLGEHVVLGDLGQLLLDGALQELQAVGGDPEDVEGAERREAEPSECEEDRARAVLEAGDVGADADEGGRSYAGSSAKPSEAYASAEPASCRASARKL